jgi:cardiolipin synthase A/B
VSGRGAGFDRSLVRNGALAAGLGLASVYAYGTAKYRHNAKRGFTFEEDPPVPGSPEFSRLLEVLTGAPVRSGNRVQVLRNGDQTFPAMLEAIRSAQRTVDLSSYILWPGRITDAFIEALTERARAGLDVNVVVDGWGSAKLDRPTVDRLEDAGVRFSFFRPPRWYTVHKLNNRMHRRLLIIDGRVGFAGGVGIADVWTGHAQDPEHWRETHVRLEGPAVRDVLGGFNGNWAEATKVILGPSHLPDLETFDDGADVQVIRSSPGAGGTAVALMFAAALAGARERLWITTAYLVPGDAVVDVLCRAARRGVDVRLLVNGPHIDKEVVRRTGRRRYDVLLESGVRIFEYQQTMLHAKVLLADGWANVGSSNLEHRSQGLDEELTVGFTDPAVVAEFEKDFLADLDVCQEIELDAWRKRPLRDRAAERAGDLLRQSL